eukprot:TRINITY_DN7598_c0_g2_i1.p1 TRINITY_DN7598_c0_g2~~TRINITY_DN7598_c0_g2_i1.p1  ORF type:complete len:672 (-),score=218.08 TRINITY_DN7598_c0_g2_i1:26-1987(-)
MALLLQGLCNSNHKLEALICNKNFNLGKGKAGINMRLQLSEALRHLAKAPRNSLQVLHIAGGPLKQSQLREQLNPFLLGLAESHSLTDINISGHRAGYSAAVSLANAVQINERIKKLYWDDNLTPLLGFKHFMMALETSCNLIECPIPLNDLKFLLTDEQACAEVGKIIASIQSAISTSLSKKIQSLEEPPLTEKKSPVLLSSSEDWQPAHRSSSDISHSKQRDSPPLSPTPVDKKKTSSVFDNIPTLDILSSVSKTMKSKKSSRTKMKTELLSKRESSSANIALKVPKPNSIRRSPRENSRPKLVDTKFKASPRDSESSLPKALGSHKHNHESKATTYKVTESKINENQDQEISEQQIESEETKRNDIQTIFERSSESLAVIPLEEQQQQSESSQAVEPPVNVSEPPPSEEPVQIHRTLKYSSLKYSEQIVEERKATLVSRRGELSQFPNRRRTIRSQEITRKLEHLDKPDLSEEQRKKARTPPMPSKRERDKDSLNIISFPQEPYEIKKKVERLNSKELGNELSTQSKPPSFSSLNYKLKDEAKDDEVQSAKEEENNETEDLIQSKEEDQDQLMEAKTRSDTDLTISAELILEISETKENEGTASCEIDQEETLQTDPSPELEEENQLSELLESPQTIPTDDNPQPYLDHS